MNFPRAVASGFRRIFDFKTRSSRSEYWWWVLFILTSHILVAIFSPLTIIWFFVLIIPSWAVAVRRLHDVDASGWWMLLNFFPPLNFALLIAFCTRGTQGSNRFGADPLA